MMEYPRFPISEMHVGKFPDSMEFHSPNFRVEKGAVTKSHKGKKAYVERKVGECFLWKSKWTMFERRLM